MELEELVNHKLQAVVVENLVKVEGVKCGQINTFKRHFQMLYVHVNEVNHDEEL